MPSPGEITYAADFELDLSGDFELSADGDFNIIDSDELYTQELELLFRSTVDFRSYIGQDINGEEGELLGDLIKDDIMEAIYSNDILQALELVIDVIPLPDNKLLIEVSSLADEDSEPVLTGSLNFESGQIEGLEPSLPTIDSVYDTDGTPVLEKEIVKLEAYSNTFAVSHQPSTLEGAKVYRASDILLTLNREIVGASGSHEYTISAANEYTTNIFNILSMFPDGDVRLDNIDSLIITNENDEEMEYTLTDDEVTIHNLKSEYTDLIFNLNFSNHVASIIQDEMIEYNSVMNEGRTIIFPHDRILGTVYLTVDAELEPGTYYVVYYRYPSRVG